MCAIFFEVLCSLNLKLPLLQQMATDEIIQQNKFKYNFSYYFGFNLSFDGEGIP